MANLNGYILTSAGKNLFAKASSGECNVVFTKAKIGEAETTIDEMLTRTDLIGTKLKMLDIVSSKAEENKFTIITTVTNVGQDEHFYIRQLGVFAKGVSTDGLDTDVLAETLIAVAYDTNPDVIPAQSNNVPYTKEIDIGFSINNADKCEVTLSLAGVITQEVLKNHNDDDEAHTNALKKYVPLIGGTMTGLLNLFANSTVPTPEQNDDSKKISNTEWVQTTIKGIISQLSDEIEVEWSGSTFTVPALGITGLMAQNGYICLGKLFGGLILQWGIVMCSEVTGTYYVKGVSNLPISFNKCFRATCSHGGIGSTTAIINLFNNTSIGTQMGMPGNVPSNLPWGAHYIAIGV